MSRSYKKNPFTGLTYKESEKRDKTYANRALRKKVKQLLLTNACAMLPSIREISNRSFFDKDGKQRFDPLKYKNFFRK